MIQTHHPHSMAHISVYITAHVSLRSACAIYNCSAHALRIADDQKDHYAAIQLCEECLLRAQTQGGYGRALVL